MKSKIYILIAFFVMFLSINNVYALDKKEVTEGVKNTENHIIMVLEDQHFGINGSNTGTGGNVSCDQLIDSSVKDLINEVLSYPKYIIPAIIIFLGTMDMFKAIIAGKEDEMKKALRTLIKRVIIGILIFLVPAFINAIIWLANIAWEGSGLATCPM